MLHARNNAEVIEAARVLAIHHRFFSTVADNSLVAHVATTAFTSSYTPNVFHFPLLTEYRESTLQHVFLSSLSISLFSLSSSFLSLFSLMYLCYSIPLANLLCPCSVILLPSFPRILHYTPYFFPGKQTFFSSTPT